jgi:hypothetical protein
MAAAIVSDSQNRRRDEENNLGPAALLSSITGAASTMVAGSRFMSKKAGSSKNLASIATLESSHTVKSKVAQFP